MSRLVILSDDITGCVDSGALLCSAGCRVRVYADPEKCDIEDFQEGVLSINLSSRTLERQEARSLFYRTGQKIAKFCSGAVMKKLDTGFRGNASQEIEGLMDALGKSCCFLIAHAPWRNIYTLHGCQYFEGKPLDSSLVAAEDPLRRPTEKSLIEILSKDTRLSVCSIDISEVRGNDLCGAVRRRLAQGYNLIVFDAVTVEDGQKITGELLESFPDAVWAGSGGLAWAFAASIFGKLPAWEPDIENNPDTRSVCFSASAYSTTGRQIELAVGQGLIREIQIDMEEFYKDKERELAKVRSMALEHNMTGNVIITPRVPKGFKHTGLSEMILEAVSGCAVGICGKAVFDRLVVIGGETAQSVLAGLGINTLEVTRKTETGIGTGVILDSEFAGKTFSFKGGVGGTPAALCRMLGSDLINPEVR